MTRQIGRWITALFLCAALTACDAPGIDPGDTGPFAPGVDLSGDNVDQIEIAHRLIAAGEYELALRAFNRATLQRGALDAEILAGMGSANLGLGRLGQAERQLRRAVEDYEAWPEIWNNLGVVLMEQGETAEAVQVFERAFALDDGESTLIRDNLRQALAKLENSATVQEKEYAYTLVRRGTGNYILRPATQ